MEDNLITLIPDDELSLIARDVLTFHIEGFVSDESILHDIIEQVRVEYFCDTNDDALRTAIYMLTLEIVERYSKNG